MYGHPRAQKGDYLTFACCAFSKVAPVLVSRHIGSVTQRGGADEARLQEGVQGATTHSPTGWFGVKVIGAGFGRTGTASLKVALEELGYGPCYHMSEIFANPDHIKVWEAAMRGHPADWNRLFRDYRATVDWPGAAFYEELMERYPDAKVILTVRDSDRWYESARSTIYNIQNIALSPVFSLAALFIPRLRHLRRAALMAADLVWKRTFDGRFEEREYAIKVFERWNKAVEKRVPAEKLLVYEVKEGWEPLCGFLGAKEPDKPFPHLNSAAEMRRMIVVVRLLSVAALTLLSIAVFALLRKDLRALASRVHPV